MCKAQTKVVQALQQHQNSQMEPKKLKITPKYPKIKNVWNKKVFILIIISFYEWTIKDIFQVLQYTQIEAKRTKNIDPDIP